MLFRSLRLEMCGCFRALADSPDIPQLEVSGWEIAQAEAGKRNYTVLTVEKLAQEKKKAAAKKPTKKPVSGNYNPVKAGLRARKQAAEQQRKQRKQYFHDKAVAAAIERSRQQKEEQ